MGNGPMTQRMFCTYYPEPKDLRVEDGGGDPAATDPGAESQAEEKGSGISRGKQLSILGQPPLCEAICCSGEEEERDCCLWS